MCVYIPSLQTGSNHNNSNHNELNFYWTIYANNALQLYILEKKGEKVDFVLNTFDLIVISV